MAGLEALGDSTPAGEPVLCHNNLNPGNVLLGRGGQLIVTGWEHANGLPPEWELSAALASWAVNPNGGINASGARALFEGYRRRAGSLPALSLDTFRGAATGLQNYVAGQVNWALNATGTHDHPHADRSVRHLLTHLPSVQTYGRVLDAALTGVAGA
jgi:aminoglycoside phosphotransferase (APT) family kinase protein